MQYTEDEIKEALQSGRTIDFYFEDQDEPDKYTASLQSDEKTVTVKWKRENGSDSRTTYALHSFACNLASRWKMKDVVISKAPIPHKHAEFIIAWANGHKIQFSNDGKYWSNLSATIAPAWEAPFYRIAPETKPVKKNLWIGRDTVTGHFFVSHFMTDEEAEGLGYHQKINDSEKEFEIEC